MNLQITSFQGHTVVGVEGRIDTINAAEFEKQMLEIINGGITGIVLDCSGLNYISSSGLRVFLVVQKKIISLKGSFRLCSFQPGIKEIFDISGFSSIFSIFPDIDTATKA